MTAPISVLIVEDHNLFRTGIRAGCQRDKAIHIAGEAVNGEEAVNKAASLSPDVILMDIAMPVMDGIESTRLIREKQAKTKIIMLTSQDSDEAIQSALSSGANGYCLKEVDSTLLCSAIKAVHRGETWLDPSLSKTAKERWAEAADKESGFTKGNSSLSQSLTKTLKVDLRNNNPNGAKYTASTHPNKMAPKTFAERYECMGLLGKGGMSEVYKAKHKLLDKVVAVKFLAKQLSSLESFAARFAQEAIISGKLCHPNIASVSDFGFTDEGSAYLVMEYAEGSTLAEVLAESGNLNENDCLRIFRQLQDALFYSHSKNIIHRDIKPANVILIKNGDRNCAVKLVDFGLAKLVTENSPSITLNGEILGSPIYMSPEQCQGLELDQRSDIYSLGCLMYEAICGYPPFRGDTPMDTFRMHVEDEVPAIPEQFCSEKTRTVILKCLQKRPEDRYTGMRELEF